MIFRTKQNPLHIKVKGLYIFLFLPLFDWLGSAILSCIITTSSIVFWLPMSSRARFSSFFAHFNIAT